MHHTLIILTGASKGMGQAMAHQLLHPQVRLLCISRNIDDRLTKEAEKHGTFLEQWSADLSDGVGVAALLSTWLSALDSSQLKNATLINNAGVIGPLAPTQDNDPAQLAYALRVGLEAPMQLCAAFLNASQDWTAKRKVLNISSGLGRRPMASSAAYCAAKAGMDHFTRCLALEEALRPHGAKVCSLAPGVIDTNMQTDLRSADPRAFPDQGNFAGLHAQGQLTSPEDAAKRVLAYLERADFGEQAVADVRG
jgi:NAD(P)-dependent dehydrogenase (short-subunit alcohol dehydrogenase family)